MNVVAEETWSWRLLGEGGAGGDAHYLSVVCGSSVPYEIDFALDAEEAAQYRREGAAYIARLAAAVTYSPRSYRARHIADFRAARSAKSDRGVEPSRREE